MISESGTLVVSKWKCTWFDFKTQANRRNPQRWRLALQAFQVTVSVLVVVKRTRPLIAADDRMVERSVSLNPELACAGAKLAGKRTISRIAATPR